MSDMDTEQFGPLKFAAENKAEIGYWFLCGVSATGVLSFGVMAGVAAKGVSAHGTIGLVLGAISTVMLVLLILFAFIGKAERDKRKAAGKLASERLERRVVGETSDKLHDVFDKERAASKATIAEVQAQADDLKVNVDEWKKEVAQLRVERDQRQAEIGQLCRERDGLKVDLRDAERRLADLKKQLEAMTSDRAIAAGDFYLRLMKMIKEM